MSKPLAVITGASAGIGATFARKLAARGYDLWLVARREDRLSALGRELSAAHGVAAESVVADLTQQSDLEALAERIRSAPNLALLVNNAGFGTNHYFFEADPKVNGSQFKRLYRDLQRLNGERIHTNLNLGNLGNINPKTTPQIDVKVVGNINTHVPLPSCD